MALNVTDATFEAETNEGLVLVDFGHLVRSCMMQAPILEQLSEEMDEDELKIVKIDVDEIQKQLKNLVSAQFQHCFQKMAKL